MGERSMKTARVVSVIAATVISLACGTNYVYSAWAPQFAERMKLSSTETNLIGTMANLGMYASGVPIGILVDARGPRIPVMLGAVTLGLGYYPIHKAFDAGPGSLGVPALSFFSLLTGVGSCAAFAAAVKTSALNWPTHRGTATAFPLAGFGLSAFFFSALSSTIAHHNASDFLFLLAIGTFSMVFVSWFFLRVLTPPPYEALPSAERRSLSDSTRLHRTKSGESTKSGHKISNETGRQAKYLDSANTVHERSAHPYVSGSQTPEEGHESTEVSSLMSKASSLPGDLDGQAEVDKDQSHHLDIRGFAMFSRIDFWSLFILLGLLTGVGLMTINNIGNDAQALWAHYDDSVTPDFIQKRQIMHVSILSVCSFAGRLLSGVGSDVLVKRFGMSRFWCLLCASVIFTVAQIFAIRIENPHHLWAVSGLNGLAYGTLFGVYPAMVADAFGIHGLSLNWGIFTLGPVFAGNLFNLIYGRVFDLHSDISEGGERRCPDGLKCYSSAYYVTLFASILGIGLNIWCMRDERRRLGRGIGGSGIDRLA